MKVLLVNSKDLSLVARFSIIARQYCMFFGLEAFFATREI